MASEEDEDGYGMWMKTDAPFKTSLHWTADYKCSMADQKKHG